MLKGAIIGNGCGSTKVIVLSGRGGIKMTSYLVSLVLSERKAAVNAVNGDGASPLHDAVSRGELSIVEELLESGASTSIRPHSG